MPWRGTPGSRESRIGPPQGSAFGAIDFSGVRGKGLATLVLLPLKLLRAFAQAWGVLRRVRPDVVVGLGGYVTFPGGLMAAAAGKPLVLHEQNSVPGLANKVLAGVADRIFTAFPGVLKKGRWVGNPLRAAFTRQAAPAERFAGRSGPLRLLVVGGSLGARALNEIVPQALALLPPERRPIVTHQSGATQIEQLRANYQAAGVQATLVPFIDGHGLCRGRPDRLSRRRQHRHRDRRRGRGRGVRAVPARGGRPPERQRALSRRRGRGLAGAAARPHARVAGRAAIEYRAPRAGAAGAGSQKDAKNTGHPRGGDGLRGAGFVKHAIRHIHFVGIGGSGMCGIAEVLHNLGYRVSGSDLADSATLQRLASLGIATHVGHAAAHIAGADALVTSTAVQPDNPEVLAARAAGVPVVPRALMLAELMRLRRGIAIAGAHGKTTTTSLVASVLAEGGLDPTYVIGGRLNSAGANARLGQGEYIVVEADESDASFLNLLPVMAVVTNIDADHMETYGHDFGRLKQAFVDFLHRMPFYGRAILCVDDPAVRAILAQVTCPVTRYGLGEDAQVRASDVRAVGTQMHFRVQRRLGGPAAAALPELQVVLNLPGLHNVLNALAAIAVAAELEVPDDALLRALAGFTGVGRRFQSHGELPAAGGGHFTLIEDYGHHPVEMAATLAAARGAWPGRRVVLAFQPHRYSRTRDCFEDFVAVLGQADAVLLTEVYAAGEAPIVAADGRALARALRVAARVEPVFVEDVRQLPQRIAELARAGDVVLCMGAGSIGAVASATARLLQNKELPAQQGGAL